MRFFRVKIKRVFKENVESYLYFYNYKRIHLAIRHLTPVEKMAELKKVA
jgi:transposase InsO family protein